MKSIRQHLTAKLIASYYQKKDGTRQIFLRVLIDRQQWRIETGINVPGVKWNPDKEIIKGNSAEVRDMNFMLNELKQRAVSIGLEFRLKNKHLTMQQFREIWENGSSYEDFWRYCEYKLEQRRGVIKNSTYKQHKAITNKMARLVPDAAFNEIDHNWIDRIVTSLRAKGNQPQTINNALKVLKVYFKAAEKDGILFDFDPSDIKVKSFNSYRTHLSAEEVNRLLRYYHNEFCADNHRKVLQYFLFSCMTGLRFSDIGKLRREDVQGGYIYIIPEKTNRTQKFLRFRLNETALSLLNPIGNQLFEHVYSNQKTNEYLKDIARHLSIDKLLTYHVSRHTFATLILKATGNVEIVRQLLGHSALSITMRYMHTDTSELDESISKLDSLL